MALEASEEYLNRPPAVVKPASRLYVCRFRIVIDVSSQYPRTRFGHSAWDVTIDAVARHPNERIDPAAQGTA